MSALIAETRVAQGIVDSIAVFGRLLHKPLYQGYRLVRRHRLD